MESIVNNTEESIRKIIIGIRKVNDDFRSKHPWVNYQNLWGFLIFAFSITCIILSYIGWWKGIISPWVCILLIAFFTSFLHELEHDLIHELYFKNNPWMYHILLFGVWIFRPLTLNPWYRKYWHHFHHQHSGTKIDIEERGVTNGEKWSFLRAIMLPDLVLSFLFRFRRLQKEIREEFALGKIEKNSIQKLKNTILWGMLPLGIPLHLIWYLFVIVLGMHLFNFSINPDIESQIISLSTPIIVGLIAPNLIRQLCLHFITSNMHYYGDVEDGNIIQQTQVLNKWWTLPFHLFCFNFGSTHAIHHFVVNEPFYLRQFTVSKAHKILKENGVRFNDTGTFKRGNRFHFTKI